LTYSLRHFSICAASAASGFLVSHSAQAQTLLVGNTGSVPYVVYESREQPPFIKCETQGHLGTDAFGRSGNRALMVLGLNYEAVGTDGVQGPKATSWGPAHLQFSSPTEGTITYHKFQVSKMTAPAVKFSEYSSANNEANGTFSIAMIVTISAAKPCVLPVRGFYRTLGSVPRR
jgi:hypothetical protein